MATPRRKYPRVFTPVPKWLNADLAARSGPVDDPALLFNSTVYGNVVRRDVGRYYSLIADELLGLHLTERQLAAIYKTMAPLVEAELRRPHASLSTLGEKLGITRQRVLQLIQANSPRITAALRETGIALPAHDEPPPDHDRELLAHLRQLPELGRRKLTHAALVAVLDAVEVRLLAAKRSGR